MIDYDDSTHTYSYRGRRYTSATQVIDLFSNEFDSHEQAKAYATKTTQTPEHWLDRWEDIAEVARRRGNRLHGLKEDITRNRGSFNMFGTPHVVQNEEMYGQYQKLSDLPDGLYPELILWNHEYRIAGRADGVILETIPGSRELLNGGREVWYRPDVRRAHIFDYKTNRFIRTRSWRDSHGNYITMKAPLSHIQDCAMQHYYLQLSLYQFMLESHGFLPGDRQIIHYPHRLDIAPGGAEGPQPPPKVYACPYQRDDVLSMVEYLKR